MLGSFSKSQRIKDYLLSAFYPRKKLLPARELEYILDNKELPVKYISF